jgi:hypothetical protein
LGPLRNLIKSGEARRPSTDEDLENESLSMVEAGGKGGKAEGRC